MYSNLKRYDSKGRRVAIFAREIEVVERLVKRKKLEIFLETCSKKDHFNKDYSRVRADWFFKKGLKSFRNVYPHDRPLITTIDILEGKPKVTFLNWCRDNYFALETNEILTPKKGELVKVGKHNRIIVKTFRK